MSEITVNSLSFTGNSLPNDKFLDWTKLKTFADMKLNVVKMMISLLYRVENIVGKGGNAGCQHFLFFPQCFPKTSSLRGGRDCVVKLRIFNIPANN